MRLVEQAQARATRCEPPARRVAPRSRALRTAPPLTCRGLRGSPPLPTPPHLAQADPNLDAPDKPTLALLKYMGASNYAAPDDWAGSRELE